MYFMSAGTVCRLSLSNGIALASSVFVHGFQRRRRAMFIEHLTYQRRQPRRGDMFFSAHMALLTELVWFFLPRLQTCRAYGTWCNQFRRVELAPY